ncbi:LacI family DNA-binding transcriptional regulator [Pollutimonas bauzanensis]|uniref:DNA-binding transcriptional regulator, LacI/PurR family n=1 Tax=Pollutimonas bauzanensis TaxID=658167 RepID=A0A1M5SCR9_9BURK|nr:LacI family DNA-binding transcriptional regulator [Pollutimonas bauzanensis]SHH36078.1 DNA-binding transcriptional regulator, LacI/PurR family [Pollutimonas bauzanensis]
MRNEHVKDVTIKDIAQHLGISHPTVSRALRDHPSIRAETRLAVKEAARQLGYIANSGARTLSRTRSELIGVIFPDVQNDFYSRTMSTLASMFLERGFKLVLATSEDSAETEFKHIQSLREARVAGVIIAPTANLKNESVELLRSIPTVQLLRSHPLLECSIIKLDERSGIATAMEHLIEKGHSRIGFIGGSGTLSTGVDRAAGYIDALQGHGIPLMRALLRQGPPRPHFGYQAMSDMLSMKAPPSAVVMASSELTLGGIEAIQERKISVPADLALIAYHDPAWFKLWGAGITCLRLPIEQMAAAAAMRLLNQILADAKSPMCAGSETLDADTPFASQLVVRGTT